MTDFNYIKFWLWLMVVIPIGYTTYDFGYMTAQEKHQVSPKFRCHQEVVYRWTGGYWEKLGLACKTDEQMKEKNP